MYIVLQIINVFRAAPLVALYTKIWMKLNHNVALLNQCLSLSCRWSHYCMAKRSMGCEIDYVIRSMNEI